eukprot:SAG11_NODE_1056_length_6009_cov_30.238877_4_plen_154_part_00
MTRSMLNATMKAILQCIASMRHQPDSLNESNHTHGCKKEQPKLARRDMSVIKSRLLTIEHLYTQRSATCPHKIWFRHLIASCTLAKQCCGPERKGVARYVAEADAVVGVAPNGWAAVVRYPIGSFFWWVWFVSDSAVLSIKLDGMWLQNVEGV